MGMVLHLQNVPDILTHMMNPVPKFNCAYAALDTSTTCYSSALADSVAQEVKKFIGTTFRRSIPKQKRLEIASQYPKPNMPATKVPRFDRDTKGALDRDFPNKGMSRWQRSKLRSWQLVPP